MKSLFIVFPLSILMVCSCHLRGRSGVSSSVEGPGDEVVELDLSEKVAVCRHWRELEDWAYPFEVPAQEDVRRWEYEFEFANYWDSVRRADLVRYSNMDHWVAANDFLEFLYRYSTMDFPSQDDSRTLWRLIQYAPNLEQLQSAPGFERILFIRQTIEQLLDFTPRHQVDLLFKSFLLTDLDRFYTRILLKDIVSKVEGPVADALKREKKLADYYHDSAWESYMVLDRNPGLYNPTVISYRTWAFRDIDIRMEMEALETVLKALYKYDPTVEITKGTVTEKDIIREFTVFSRHLYNDRFSAPVSEQKSALIKDRHDFLDWMAYRERVSALLSGNLKDAYDRATGSILRDKLIQLKNRYNVNCDYCLENVRQHLLGSDCTDEELFSHQLENLIEDE